MNMIPAIMYDASAQVNPLPIFSENGATHARRLANFRY